MDVNIDKLIDEKVHLENELEPHKIEKYKFDEAEQSMTEYLRNVPAKMNACRR